MMRPPPVDASISVDANQNPHQLEVHIPFSSFSELILFHINKIILKEFKTPPESIVIKLKDLRKKKNKPFFDNKNQLDLNCLWVSALISAEKVLPNYNFLRIAPQEMYM